MKIILVIESNQATREALCDLLLLEWPHLTVVTADSGEAGLELATRLKIDLVIFEGNCIRGSDLDGDMLARKLRQIPNMKNTPLIAVTTPILSHSRGTQGLTAYCNAWLLKPFSAERLIRVVSPFTYMYS